MWVLNAHFEENGPDTWIATNDLHSADNITIYIASIYWAFSTLLTVGYGDINANSNQEMLVAIAWMCIGASFYSFAIGNLTAVLANLDT